MPRRVLVVLALLVAPLAAAQPARAAFPGTDGRIATSVYRPVFCIPTPRPPLGCVFVHRLTTVAPTGGLRRDFGAVPGGMREPAVSADGRRIAALGGVRDESDPKPVYEGRMDGPVFTKVRTAEPGTTARVVTTATSVAWTPDGRLLLTRGNRILIRDSASAPLRVLLEAGADERLGEVTASPDGASIAFTRLGPDDFGYQTAVWLADADGTDPRPFAEPGEFGFARSPDFSPDGTRLAYTNDQEIRIAPVATGVPVTVPYRFLVSEVAWSPSGTRLALIDGGAGGVTTIAADGTDERPVLTIGGSSFAYGVSWAPRPGSAPAG